MVSDPGSDEVVNWISRAWRYVKREWPKVKAVKGPFFGVLTVGVAAAIGVTWLAVRGVYTSEIEGLQREKGSLGTTIESLKGTIAQQSEYLNQLRYQTQTGTNPEAIEKIQKLQKELNELRAGATVSIQIGEPTWKKNEKGEWVIAGRILVVGKFSRTGLLIGVETDKPFTANVSNPGVMIGGEYASKSAWTHFGSYRYYIQNPQGYYTLTVVKKSTEPIEIRHVFEGEKEGQVVTWKIP